MRLAEEEAKCPRPDGIGDETVLLVCARNVGRAATRHTSLGVCRCNSDLGKNEDDEEQGGEHAAAAARRLAALAFTHVVGH